MDKDNKEIELEKRSKYLVDIFKRYIDKKHSILEIGSGDGRNVEFLKKAGFKNVEGIDKKDGTPIEKIEEKKYDVVYTMSTLFLLPKESEWVFEKISRMVNKYLITIEGETTKTSLGVTGRDYGEIFSKLGFFQVRHSMNVFNDYGHLRVFKKIDNFNS